MRDVEPGQPLLLCIDECAKGTRLRITASDFYYHGKGSISFDSMELGICCRYVDLRAFFRDSIYQFDTHPPQFFVSMIRVVAVRNNE